MNNMYESLLILVTIAISLFFGCLIGDSMATIDFHKQAIERRWKGNP